ncbi:unnamed protein product [Adineta ricciae]|uniref:Uncharacterized protein n=1 Tax=Adineta ricciae TaxID=249248 RepID=A0A815NTS6_ADIRI|nr:unnamed protein product [Adineta ricciae]
MALYTTGSFSITAFDSDAVHLQHMAVEPIYASALTRDHTTFSRLFCFPSGRFYYEVMQVNVNGTGIYTILGSSNYMSISSYIYEYDFYSVLPFGNLISGTDNDCYGLASPITARLTNKIRYVLVVTSKYSLELTIHRQKYSKDCTSSLHYYESIRLIVSMDAYYTVSTKGDSDTYIDIYENPFDPMDPHRNENTPKYTVCFTRIRRTVQVYFELMPHIS